MNNNLTFKAEIYNTIPALLNRDTQDKEALYQELKELCLDLGIPYMESYIDILYGYPDTELKHLETYPKRSESWVRNAYNVLMSRMAGINMDNASPNWGTGYINWKNTGGTIRGLATPFCHFGNTTVGVEDAGVYLRWGAGSTSAGILVGSDATAESFEHYNLQSQLSTNQTHDAMAAPAFTQASLTSKIAYSRKITNATGGQITYREVGLFCREGQYNDFVMLSRDLITPALALNNTGFLTPTYTIALTYPS